MASKAPGHSLRTIDASLTWARENAARALKLLDSLEGVTGSNETIDDTRLGLMMTEGFATGAQTAGRWAHSFDPDGIDATLGAYGYGRGGKAKKAKRPATDAQRANGQRMKAAMAAVRAEHPGMTPKAVMAAAARRRTDDAAAADMTGRGPRKWSQYMANKTNAVKDAFKISDNYSHMESSDYTDGDGHTYKKFPGGGRVYKNGRVVDKHGNPGKLEADPDNYGALRIVPTAGAPGTSGGEHPLPHANTSKT